MTIGGAAASGYGGVHGPIGGGEYHENREINVAYSELKDTDSGSTAPDTASGDETHVGSTVRETRMWSEEMDVELLRSTCGVGWQPDRSTEFTKDAKLADLREEANHDSSGYCGELDWSSDDETGTEDDARWTSDEEADDRPQREGPGRFHISCQRLQKANHNSLGGEKVIQETSKKKFGVVVGIASLTFAPYGRKETVPVTVYGGRKEKMMAQSVMEGSSVFLLVEKAKHHFPILTNEGLDYNTLRHLRNSLASMLPPGIAEA
ncbi:hypothetical protein TGRUB_225830B [Toxoplasma gondii RUB]|uniref:Uncharacterized protein n=1 Tax=Toxoplasma gondii RUB TaxID=935652 RepID=A0A086LW18_TOXGO|nr:hypothetical protein TGRUB_225830B [Toxoplasma gondii RUB]